MLSFFKRLFSKKELYTPLISEEYWSSDFQRRKNRRWNPETQKDSSLRFDKRGMNLSITKKSFFVWYEAEESVYKDVALEAALSFERPADTRADSESDADKAGGNAADPRPAPQNAGECAFGFLIRCDGGDNYYALLLSNKGYVRFDAVFNGNPIAALGWTECPPPRGDDPYFIRLIARGDNFTITVNDQWIAELNDDSIQASGSIAFAGQNWGKRSRASATLHAISVDSRRIVIEAQYERWNRRARPLQRTRLADSLFACGKTAEALRQLKLAHNGGEDDGGALVFAARLYASQRLYTEADECALRALALNPANEEALAVRAETLYLQNRFDELLAFFDERADLCKNDALLANLRGHAFYETQRWREAADAYAAAAEISPDEGLYSLNEAKACEKLLGSESSADEKTQKRLVASYTAAARAFLRADNFADMEAALTPLARLAPDAEETIELYGKYYYSFEETEKARECFQRLADAGSRDSSVWYLLGMLGGGERCFRKAAELEPECALYHFRLAELLFNKGADGEGGGELRRALELDPEYGWAWNLAGVRALNAENLDAAEENLNKARTLLPLEIEPLNNLAELRLKQGRLEEALALLGARDQEKERENGGSGGENSNRTELSDAADPAALAHPAQALNAAGNLLVAADRAQEALGVYDAALKLEPDGVDALVNKATACMALDMYTEADSLLAKAHELRPSAEIYKLIGYLASRKGDFPRAEISYRRGLEEFPDDETLLYELASLYLASARYQKAAEIADKLEKIAPSPKSAELKADIRRHTHRKISCSACGRLWEIPNDIPIQAPLRLTAEPPDDLPAGQCLECGAAICIGCAKTTLDETGRFHCPRCGARLKLADPGLTWLLASWAREQGL